LTKKLKDGNGATTPATPAQEPLCCSDQCEQDFTNLIKNRVERLNESSLYMLSEGIAPFNKLKGAAGVLTKFVAEVLD